jgi:hypothetical protein
MLHERLIKHYTSFNQVANNRTRSKRDHFLSWFSDHFAHRNSTELPTYVSCHLSSFPLQFLFVSRKGTRDESNHHTLPPEADPATALAQRAMDPRYPLPIVAPEATTKSKPCLLRFRQGAFRFGGPVLPVLLRYKYRHFNPRWGVEYSTPFHVWRLMSQFVNHVEVEVLPPYFPSEEEKQNPAMYAENVRRAMAEALGVPMVDEVSDSIAKCWIRILNFSVVLISIRKKTEACMIPGRSLMV